MGSHLVVALSKEGRPVRALYHRHPPESLARLPNVSWQQADLLDIYDVAAAMAGVGEVYHCAAVVSFDPAHKEKLLAINVQSTAHVVNEALQQQVRKLVHLSSVAAIGRSLPGQEIKEDNEWEESKNNSTYAVSKYAAELEVWRGMAEGLDAAILNPGIILGAPLNGNWQEGSAAMMQVAAKEFPFYTQGANAFVGVHDVVRAALLLMKSNITTERFILSAANMPYRQVFTLMAESLGRKPPHIAAGPLLSNIVWRAGALRQALTGKTATITRETARNAQLQCSYNNEKFLKAFPAFKYTPLDLVIKEMAQHFPNLNNAAANS